MVTGKNALDWPNAANCESLIGALSVEMRGIAKSGERERECVCGLSPSSRPSVDPNTKMVISRDFTFLVLWSSRFLEKPRITPYSIFMIVKRFVFQKKSNLGRRTRQGTKGAIKRHAWFPVYDPRPTHRTRTSPTESTGGTRQRDTRSGSIQQGCLIELL